MWCNSIKLECRFRETDEDHGTRQVQSKWLGANAHLSAEFPVTYRNFLKVKLCCNCWALAVSEGAQNPIQGPCPLAFSSPHPFTRSSFPSFYVLMDRILSLPMKLPAAAQSSSGASSSTCLLTSAPQPATTTHAANAPDTGTGTGAGTGNVPLPCANCQVILSVPPGLTRFACPSCTAQLSVDPARLAAYLRTLNVMATAAAAAQAGHTVTSSQGGHAGRQAAQAGGGAAAAAATGSVIAGASGAPGISASWGPASSMGGAGAGAGAGVHARHRDGDGYSVGVLAAAAGAAVPATQTHDNAATAGGVGGGDGGTDVCIVGSVSASAIQAMVAENLSATAAANSSATATVATARQPPATASVHGGERAEVGRGGEGQDESSMIRMLYALLFH